MKKIIYTIILLCFFTIMSGCSELTNVQDNKTVQYVKVSFDYQSASLQNFTKYVKSGSSVMEPKPPYNEGYTFLGWYTNSQLGFKWDFSEPVYSDTTLYAQWKSNTVTNKISVIFDPNGGSLTDSSVIEVTADSTIPEPSEPVYDGYIFLGWSDSINGSIMWDFNNKITNNTTLYAVWEKIEE